MARNKGFIELPGNGFCEEYGMAVGEKEIRYKGFSAAVRQRSAAETDGAAHNNPE